MRRAKPSPKPPDLSYRIGYTRPPQHTRFVKGQSGNPNGRPKGLRTWSAIISDELARSMTVTIERKKTTITVFDALLYVVAERALSGSVAHIKLLLREEYQGTLPPQIILWDGDPTDRV
jgi:hypothetical protein